MNVLQGILYPIRTKAFFAAAYLSFSTSTVNIACPSLIRAAIPTTFPKENFIPVLKRSAPAPAARALCGND